MLTHAPPLRLLIETTPTAILGGTATLKPTDSSSFVGTGAAVIGWHVGGGEERIFLASYFPVVLFGADGEFEVFLGDGIPVLWKSIGLGLGLS